MADQASMLLPSSPRSAQSYSSQTSGPRRSSSLHTSLSLMLAKKPLHGWIHTRRSARRRRNSGDTTPVTKTLHYQKLRSVDYYDDPPATCTSSILASDQIASAGAAASSSSGKRSKVCRSSSSRRSSTFFRINRRIKIGFFIASPFKLLRRIKDAYVRMMMGFAGLNSSGFGKCCSSHIGQLGMANQSLEAGKLLYCATRPHEQLQIVEHMLKIKTPQINFSKSRLDLALADNARFITQRYVECSRT